MRCPECSGPVQPDHPDGWLALLHTSGCGLYEADSQTRAADRERWEDDPHGFREAFGLDQETWVRFADAYGWLPRAATPTERTLLSAQGHPVDGWLPLVTLVGSFAMWPGHRRRWPQLEAEAQAEQGGDSGQVIA